MRRRSLLYVPGASYELIEKAVTSKADGIIVDLEDSVIPEKKQEARSNIICSLSHIRKAGKETLVRINPFYTPFGVDDIIAAVNGGADTIILPKADLEAIVTADNILVGLENKHKISPCSVRLMPLIETAKGVLEVENLLKFTERINGVSIGAEDLMEESNTFFTTGRPEIKYARSHVAMAGVAAGIDIIDTPYAVVRDIEGLITDCADARTLGYTGKACITPRHIEEIHRVFSISDTEIREANELLKAFDEAQKTGDGVFSHKGKMIDTPALKRARKILERR